MKVISSGNIRYEMSISDLYRNCQHHQDGILELPLGTSPVIVKKAIGLRVMYIQLTVVSMLFVIRNCNGDVVPLRNSILTSSGL